MPRLFVALDLPKVVARRLAKSQPPPMRGIRLVPPEQMHVTLHFIGESEIAPVSGVLDTIQHQAFTLTIDNIGKFKAAGGGTIIWAGIQPSSDLTSLHAVLGKRLASIGLKPENMSYKPHVTLARCSAAASQAMPPGYLHTNTELLIPNIPVIQMTLYSSMPAQSGPIYQVEGRYRLTP